MDTKVWLEIVAIGSAIVTALIAMFKSNRERGHKKEDEFMEYLKQEIKSLKDQLLSKKEFVTREEILRMDDKLDKILIKMESHKNRRGDI